MHEIISSRRFKKNFRKLPKRIQAQAEERIAILAGFEENPLYFRIHPLHGKLRGYFSLRINFQIRIIFSISPEENLLSLIDIGDHYLYNS